MSKKLTAVPIGEWVQAFEATGSKPGDGGACPYRDLWLFEEEQIYLWTQRKSSMEFRPMVTGRHWMAAMWHFHEGWLHHPQDFLVMRLPPHKEIFPPVN